MFYESFKIIFIKKIVFNNLEKVMCEVLSIKIKLEKDYKEYRKIYFFFVIIKVFI